jgi:hypothetical protein
VVTAAGGRFYGKSHREAALKAMKALNYTGDPETFIANAEAQGRFETTTDRVVKRNEAMQIAKGAKQVRPEAMGNTELHSADLLPEPRKPRVKKQDFSAQTPPELVKKWGKKPTEEAVSTWKTLQDRSEQQQIQVEAARRSTNNRVRAMGRLAASGFARDQALIYEVEQVLRARGLDPDQMWRERGEAKAARDAEAHRALEETLGHEVWEKGAPYGGEERPERQMTKQQLRSAITMAELNRDLGREWNAARQLELADMKQEWARRYGREWRGVSEKGKPYGAPSAPIWLPSQGRGGVNLRLEDDASLRGLENALNNALAKTPPDAIPSSYYEDQKVIAAEWQRRRGGGAVMERQAPYAETVSQGNLFGGEDVAKEPVTLRRGKEQLDLLATDEAKAEVARKLKPGEVTPTRLGMNVGEEEPPELPGETPLTLLEEGAPYGGKPGGMLHGGLMTEQGWTRDTQRGGGVVELAAMSDAELMRNLENLRAGKPYKVRGNIRTFKPYWIEARFRGLVDEELQPTAPQSLDAAKTARLKAKAQKALDEVNRGGVSEEGKPYGARPQPQLSALHNLSAENLAQSDKLGGFPAPSLAVVPENVPHTQYGEITMIGRGSLVEPSGTPIYSADAYTGRPTPPEYPKVPSRKAEAFLKRLRNLAGVKTGSADIYDAWDGLVNSARPREAIEGLQRSAAGASAFLHERGITPAIEVTEKSVSGQERFQTADALRKQIADAGLTDDFQTWAHDQIMSQFGEPFVRVRGKKMPYTLENVVASSPKGRAREKGLTYGPGTARAAASTRFTNLEQMRRAAAKGVLPRADVDERRKALEKQDEQWRAEVVDYYTGTNWEGRKDIWNGLDAVYRALGRWGRGGKTAANLRLQLSRQGFANVPQELIDRGVEIGTKIMSGAVPYFEGKPTRGVKFDEFAGAVIPADASAKTKEILDRRGIPYRTYATPEEREAVTKSFRSELDQGTGQTLREVGPLYHGSPHRFDRFDISKIGTGEGAQAFGWGLYFAGGRGTGEFYKNKLSGRSESLVFTALGRAASNELPGWVRARIATAPLGSGVNSPAGQTSEIIADFKQRIAETDAEIAKIVPGLGSWEQAQYAQASDRARGLRNVLDRLEQLQRAGDYSAAGGEGALYEVTLPGEEADYLDWDKGRESQPPKVQQAVDKLLEQHAADIESLTPPDQNPPQPGDWMDYKGGQVYRLLAHVLDDDQQAVSEALRANGVIGNRYLDRASRKRGTGTSNYVVYSDQDIQIKSVAEPQQLELVFGSEPAMQRAARLGLQANKVPTLDARLSVMPPDSKTAVTIAGKRAANAEDIALVVRPIRSPFVETFGVLLVGPNGEPVSVDAMMSGAINYVQVDVEKLADTIAERVKATGAVKAAPFHNHPSGNATPSRPEDTGLTEALGAALKRRGVNVELEHHIINHQTVSVIRLDAKGKAVVEENLPITPPAGEPVPDWTQVQGPELTTPGAVVAAVGHVADHEILAVYRNTHGMAVALSPHRASARDDIGTWLPKEMREVGAAKAILVTPGNDRALWLGLATDSRVHDLGVLDVIGLDHRSGVYDSAAARGLISRRTDPFERVSRAAGGEATRPGLRAGSALREPTAPYGEPVPSGRGAGEPVSGAGAGLFGGVPEGEDLGDLARALGQETDPAKRRELIERVGRIYDAMREGRGPAPDINPTDYLNVNRMDPKDLDRPILEDEVRRAAERMYPGGRPVKGFNEALAEAQKIAADPRRLAGIPVERMSGTERLAERLLASAEIARHGRLLRQLADPTLRDAERESIEQALATSDTRVQARLGRIMAAGTAQGRDLAYNRILANHTLDPAVWLLRAQRVRGDVLTPAMREKILGMLERGEIDQLTQYVSQLREPGTSRKIAQYAKTNMISALTTVARIFTGSQFDLWLQLAGPGRLGELMADRLARGLTKVETRSMLTGMRDTAIRSGAKQLVEEWGKIIRGEPVTGRSDVWGLGEFTNKPAEPLPGRMGQIHYKTMEALDAYEHAITRTHMGTHRLGWAPAYQKSLAEQALLLARESLATKGVRPKLSDPAVQKKAHELFAHPTDEMQNIAIDEARVATYLNRNAVADAVSALKRKLATAELPGHGVPAHAVNLGARALYLASEMTVPFAQISTNLIARGLETTPLGMATSGVALGRLVAAVAHGLPKSEVEALQREFTRRAGRLATGALLTLLGLYLYYRGRLIGYGPKDAGGKQAMKDQGASEFSIKIGDHWWSLSALGPLMMALGTAAAIGETFDDPNLSGGKRALAAATGAIGVGARESLLRGLQTGAKAIGDPLTSGVQWAQSAASALIPAGNFLAKVAQAADPWQRRPHSFTQAIESKVPGARLLVPKATGRFGQPLPGTRTLGEAFSTIANPFLWRPDATQGDPVLSEVARVKASVPAPKRRKGQSDEAYRQMTEQAGEAMLAKVREEIESGEYQGASPEDQKYFIEREARAGEREVLRDVETEEPQKPKHPRERRRPTRRSR